MKTNGIGGLIPSFLADKPIKQKVMKTKTTITELSHDDLVTLFSTALYGSTYLGADYEEAIEHNERDCFEDILANILLHGGCIKVNDYYSEGDVYGELPHELDEENECTTYFVTYDDIKRGLERAANGTFTIATRLGEDYVKGEKESARVSFNSFANEELDFDLIRADILMQIILFDEIIYG